MITDYQYQVILHYADGGVVEGEKYKTLRGALKALRHWQHDKTLGDMRHPKRKFARAWWILIHRL